MRASALARLEAAVGLVDDLGAAPAADHAAVAVARLEGLERVADLHGLERLPVLRCFLRKNARRRPTQQGLPSQAGPAAAGGDLASHARRRARDKQSSLR